MIVGTGIDLIEISRVRRALDRSEDRLMEILFTPTETEYCLQGTNQRLRGQRFAGRFAAKEAFLKALGTGLREGIGWKDIEITNDPQGKPLLTAGAKAAEKMKRLGVRNVHLSISHSINYATAVVILEK